MTTLREAAQQALEALYQAREHVTVHTDGPWQRVENDCHAAITALRAALAQEQAEPTDPGFWGRVAARQASRIKRLEAAAQQALEGWNSGDLRVLGPAMGALRTALAQEQAEPVQEEEGLIEFLADLRRSRMKYPNNRRMFDGLMDEVDELRRAYAGDGDIRAEAFDVAVCAFRIATEGDSGGNTMMKQAEPVQQRAGIPLEAALHKAYYYTEEGKWRGAEAREWDRWHGVAKAAVALLRPERSETREHVTDGTPCWCGPEPVYTDPDTGASVILHKRPQ